ncbi:MAG: hypothetical protein LBQ43_02115 [Holosporales bacterium]|jgi:hypothetical protein|nr:hypothetical protein [Holosporales bacterium]
MKNFCKALLVAAVGLVASEQASSQGWTFDETAMFMVLHESGTPERDIPDAVGHTRLDCITMGRLIYGDGGIVANLDEDNAIAFRPAIVNLLNHTSNNTFNTISDFVAIARLCIDFKLLKAIFLLEDSGSSVGVFDYFHLFRTFENLGALAMFVNYGTPARIIRDARMSTGIFGDWERSLQYDARPFEYEDVSLLIHMREAGYDIQDIADQVGHSVSRCEWKYRRIDSLDYDNAWHELNTHEPRGVRWSRIGVLALAIRASDANLMEPDAVLALFNALVDSSQAESEVNGYPG